MVAEDYKCKIRGVSSAFGTKRKIPTFSEFIFSPQDALSSSVQPGNSCCSLLRFGRPSQRWPPEQHRRFEEAR